MGSWNWDCSSSPFVRSADNAFRQWRRTFEKRYRDPSDVGIDWLRENVTVRPRFPVFAQCCRAQRRHADLAGEQDVLAGLRQWKYAGGFP